jgi:hypothetical protein
LTIVRRSSPSGELLSLAALAALAALAVPAPRSEPAIVGRWA